MDFYQVGPIMETRRKMVTRSLQIGRQEQVLGERMLKLRTYVMTVLKIDNDSHLKRMLTANSSNTTTSSSPQRAGGPKHEDTNNVPPITLIVAFTAPPAARSCFTTSS